MPSKSSTALAIAGAALLTLPASAGAAPAFGPALASAPATAPASAPASPVIRAATASAAATGPAAHSSFARAGASTGSTGTFQIHGAGDGHGIGMSQYGAAGYAGHGWDYPAILAHYYGGTTLGTVPNSTVTVLLAQGAASFRGATSANGHRLSASTSYSVVTSGSTVSLVSGGHSVGTFSAPLTVRTSGSALDLLGHGEYAGSLVFTPEGSGGVDTVNAVDLEDYVKGVIAEEMPASWPEEALEAQAVAARSYVLASGAISPIYDVYADTRSQMYGGVSGETAASNAAATATAGQVIEAAGRVIPAYFSASSGGHTESIQNVWLGASAQPYLTGVSDPYDDSENNPYYRWTDTLSLASAANSLGGLYRGTLEGIRVLRRGVSPRIISAQVVGTRGASVVSGSTLEEDLGTDSTWMSFTTVTAAASLTRSGATGAAASSANSSASSATSASTTHSSASSSSSSSGSTSRAAGASGGAGLGDLARLPRRMVSGRVFPVQVGRRVQVQRRGPDGRWAAVGTTRVAPGGDYALGVLEPGVYRALYDGAAAPVVTLG